MDRPDERDRRIRELEERLSRLSEASLRITEDLPLVMADRQRIVQVLGNLLTSAARHSPESSNIRASAVKGDVHVAISLVGYNFSLGRLTHDLVRTTDVRRPPPDAVR